MKKYLPQSLRVFSRFLLAISLIPSLFPSSSVAATGTALSSSFHRSYPKLVVVIAVDQLRADFLTRFRKRFLPARLTGKNKFGGFRYLMEKGAYYPLAEYEVLQSSTGPGHATILTGAYPYTMGIPINQWYDFQREQITYCAEDTDSPLVGLKNSPSQIESKNGRSPKLLIGTTVGDELKNSGRSSQVVSIAIKDRAAILLGGHRANLALWMKFQDGSAQWISSKHYLPDGKLPQWVEKLNHELSDSQKKLLTWKPLGKPSGLSVAQSSLVASSWLTEAHPTFPHQAERGSHASLLLPQGLTATRKAAEKAISELKLGKNKHTDFLTMSFSTFDYVGHHFGPNSLEAEEMTVLLDRELSRLFNFIHQKIPGGIANATIVLTADHGVSSSPLFLTKNKIPSGMVSESKLQDQIKKHLDQKFGELKDHQKWMSYIHNFNFYLNRKAIRESNLSLEDVRNEVKSTILKEEGIEYAFTADDYKKGHLPPGRHRDQILKTFYEKRSADVIGIFKPHYTTDSKTANHLTGYAYDRMVPLLLAGRKIRPGVFGQTAKVVDIAPTLSFILGVLPPSQSEGRVLHEALK